MNDDRLETITAAVRAACPELDADAIGSAIDATVTNPAVARELAKALGEGPEVLAGGAPPVVARLVEALRARGSGLAVPACAGCGRVGRELIRVGTVGVCGRCRSHQLAQPCSECGKVRVVYGRNPSGGPLCFKCAPRPARPCQRCGRVLPVAVRGRDGAVELCVNCYRLPMAICGSCGQERRCSFVAEGHPICAACSPRRSLLCAHCGISRPPSAQWSEGPVCERCYRAALRRRGICAGCGQVRRLIDPPGPGATRCADCAGKAGPGRACRTCGVEDLTYSDGRCARCVLGERARRHCCDRSGQIPPELVPVCDAIASHPQPYSALNWLERSDSAVLLARIAADQLALNHDALGAHPGPAAEFLRQTLVAAGALPARDEALVRLEAWVAGRLAQIPDPGRARLIRSYATWRVLRRSRQRAARSERPRTATRHAKNHLLAAIAFCDWLDHNDLTLDVVGQGDIDTWIEQAGPSAPNLRDFLDWTNSRGLTQHLEVPNRPSRQGPGLDERTRWSIVERLLHDNTLELTDRVAGCLVLLYGQQLTRIVALRVGNITTTGNGVRLNLGSSPVIIPEPLGALIVELATTRPRHTGVGSPRHSPWLFPGLHPGRPLNPSHLGARLRNHGISTMPARRSALMHLAGQLPAAVLAELLNLHPTTAVHWVAAAGSDWNAYAAQIARTQ